jgi:prephenate dehydratase
MGTNMTRLESRPVPGRPWEYVFYTDYQLTDPRLADWALEMLPRHCSMVRELGRYRAAVTVS